MTATSLDVVVVGDGGSRLSLSATGELSGTTGTGTYNGVWSDPGGTVWAVGDDGLASVRDANAQWSQVTLPTSVDLNAIDGTSAQDIWIGGDDILLHYNGATWSEVPPTFGGVINTVWASGPGRVWVAGNTWTARYDGGSWQYVDASGFPNFTRIWGSDEQNVWATAEGFNTLFRYDAQNGYFVTEPSANGLYDLGGTSSSDVWAVGSEILHYDGMNWTEVYRASAPTAPAGMRRSQRYHAVEAVAADDVWFAGAYGAIAHWDGSGWETNSGADDVYQHSHTVAGNDTDLWVFDHDGVRRFAKTSDLSLMDSVSTTTYRAEAGFVDGQLVLGLLAVPDGGAGWNLKLMSYEGAAWQELSDSPAVFVKGGLWASAVDDVVVASDNDGLQQFDGTGWTYIAPMADAQVVHGSGANNVWAAGNNKLLMRRRNGVWSSLVISMADFITGVWTDGPDHGWVVTSAGQMIEINGDTATLQATPTPWWLLGIGGASNSDLFGVDQRGAIFHYDGTHWTAENSGCGNGLTGVWVDAGANRAWIVGSGQTLLTKPL